MKRLFLMTLAMLLYFSVPSIGQEKLDLKLSHRNAQLSKVLNDFTAQTGVTFSYETSLGNSLLEKVEVNMRGASLRTCLDAVFSETKFTYKVDGLAVALSFKENEIVDDNDGKTVSTPVISMYAPIEEEGEMMMAAEPFECYKWNRFDQNIIDFFGGDKTILVGCTKNKKQKEWILSHNIYNVRLGKTKGSMEEHREMFSRTSILVLYEFGKPDKLAGYTIVDHREMNKEELKAMDYPNKNPRRNYMTFSIEPLDIDLSLLVNHRLIEKLIEINPGNEKGTPVFIEP